MKLIIKIQDNIPNEHPILLDNFIQAFPNVDISNLPKEFAWFERVPKPRIGPYEKDPYCKYEFQGNIVKDVWYRVEMTAAEKTELQNKIKSDWENTGYNSWIFNENLCTFEPPVPYPNDGKVYQWNENNINWEQI